MNRAAKWFAGLFVFALAVFATANPAIAQSSGGDVSGAWTLTVAPAPPAVVPGATTQPEAPSEARGGRGPAAPPTLTLKQLGNTITGTLAGGRGPGLAVTGTISGNTITWTLSRRLADGIARPEVYKGTLNGDTITGSVAEPTVDPTQQYSVDFTAKRTQ